MTTINNVQMHNQLMPIAQMIESAAWYTQAVANAISKTGKPLNDITIGELIKIIDQTDRATR